MNTPNLAPIQEEQLVAVDTKLYIEGGSDAAFELPPQSGESAYLAGYQAECRRNQIIKDNPLPDEFYEKTQQGVLWIGYSSLTKKFGKIAILGEEQDYQGWSIDLNGLAIDLITLGDWDKPQIETKWYVYSHHLDAMNLLAREFGMENIQYANLDPLGDSIVSKISATKELLSANHFWQAEVIGKAGTEPDQQLWSNISYKAGWTFGITQYYDNKFKAS